MADSYPSEHTHNDPVYLTDPTGMFAQGYTVDAGGSVAAGMDNTTSAAHGSAESPLLCLDATGMILFVFPDVRSLVQFFYKVGKTAPSVAGVAGPVGVTVAGACVVAPAACAIVGVAAGTIAVAAGVVVVAKMIEPANNPAQDPGDRPVARPGPAPCPLDANGLPNCGGEVATKTKTKQGCDKGACLRYKMSLEPEAVTDSSPSSQYQVQHAGLVEYKIPSVPPLWADGIDCDRCEFIDTKWAESDFSGYILYPGHIAASVQSELARYAQEIYNPASPIIGLRVITNSDAAKKNFDRDLSRHGPPPFFRCEFLPLKYPMR